MTAASLPIIHVVIVEAPPGAGASTDGGPRSAAGSLAPLLAADPRLLVAGVAAYGDAALQLAASVKPAVVLVRLARMPPGMPDGLSTVRRLMAELPLPVVACAINAELARPRALEAGAVACVEMPPMHDDGTGPGAVALRETVRLMAEVKVVRRWNRVLDARGGHAAGARGDASQDARASAVPAPAPPPGTAKGTIQGTTQSTAGRRARPPGPAVVGIGTSTGGPAVLRTILCGLPKDFPLPLLVVQHIAAGFIPGMASWLSQTCSLPVELGRYGVRPLPGHVYLAPDGLHMGLDADGRIMLAREPSPTALCPSVAFLFRSLAEVCGERAIGVLLTGMGKDGAEGLKLMKDRGALTIAQDRESSVVHGMPGEAIALGAATQIVPASQIAATLVALAEQKRTSQRNQT